MYSSQTRPEPLVQLSAVQIASDEDDGVHARIVAPRAVGSAIHQHMDALEDEAHLASLHGQHALHAENVLALGAKQRAQPVGKLFFIQVARRADAYGSDILVVVMIVLLFMLMAVMILALVIMPVVMIMLFLGGFQEIGFQF